MCKSKGLNIVYASDDNFAGVLEVSLISLLENHQNINFIRIYILDNGISDIKKKNITNVCARYAYAKLCWIKSVNIETYLNLKISLDRGSMSQYARLFIDSLLPADMCRVLYLDCDVIINKSLHELWSIDLQGKIVGALDDAFSKQYRKNINLEPKDIMFNSGVMLVDLQMWRKYKIEEKLIQFILNKKGMIQQGDQGALNAVLSKHTFCLEPRFNSVTIFFDFTYEELMVYRKPPNFYTKEEVSRAIEEPVIIHYTSSFLSKRPWCNDCQHLYYKHWLNYMNSSPNIVSLPRKRKEKMINVLFLFYFNHVPRRIGIYTAGFLQAYARPIKVYLANKIKRIT